jgi:hypothetical protein
MIRGIALCFDIFRNPTCNIVTKNPRFYLLSLFFANGPLEILLIQRCVGLGLGVLGLVYYLRIDVQLGVNIKEKLSIDFISLTS